MVRICPKYSANTETIEKETKTFYIHEKPVIVALTIILVTLGVFGTGLI